MWKHPPTQVKFLTVPDIAFILTRREADQLQINAGYYNVGICRMMCSRNLKEASLILLRRAAAALLIGLLTGFSVSLYLRLLELSITLGSRISPTALLLFSYQADSTETAESSEPSVSDKE